MSQVRPLYLRSTSGKIPELTRVIVAYQDQIVMERTLEGGLARIFGGNVGVGPGPSGTGTTPAADTTGGGAPAPPATADLAAEARAVYDRAIAAQKAGDWAKYGEEIKRLGEVLARMK